MFLVVRYQNILASLVDRLNPKPQHFFINIYSYSLTSVFSGTILISDDPDSQEGRRFQYLAQEKLSYITNYLEQTRDTDVHSVSTEDDSGKPGSSSAPSEFGFEETSGMTVCLSQ